MSKRKILLQNAKGPSFFTALWRMGRFSPMALVGLVSLSMLSNLAFADGLSEAVTAYRQGQYAQARVALERHHATNAPTAKSWYYQAITCAQLGKLEEAGQLYVKIMSTYPGTPEAQLAEVGLSHLQALGQPDLDAPPGAPLAGQSTFSQKAAALSPEQLQLQAIMGMLGTGSNNTPDLLNLMPGQGGQTPTDPSAMATWLMSQWTGQMDIGGKNDR